MMSLGRYIVKNFSDVLNEEERKTLLLLSKMLNFHHLLDSDPEVPIGDVKQMLDIPPLTHIKSRGEIESAVKVIEERIAERVLLECPESIYQNRCPICNTLARTPVAKQAPCGHRW